MSEDATPLNNLSAAAAAPNTPLAILDPGSAADHDLGYEAADPSLHAPFWSEALQSGMARSLR